MFSLGQIVRWRSQASGTYCTKQGKVVEVLPPGFKPSTRFKSLYRNRGVQTVSPRKHVSYVVEVDGKAYWPRVKKLEAVDVETVSDVDTESPDNFDDDNE